MSRSTGSNAFIRFLKDAYLHIVKDEPRVVEKSEFSAIFDRIQIEEDELNKDVYAPGSTGQGRLYKDLVKLGIPTESDEEQQNLFE